MKTGEGKTLVSILPAYLNALEGKGVYIVTTTIIGRTVMLNGWEKSMSVSGTDSRRCAQFHEER